MELKEASEEGFMPLVCCNAHSHTCIAFAQGRRYIHFIECGDYRVQQHQDSLFWREYQPLPGYGLKQAAEKYLQHAELHGATERALEILQQLATGAYDMATNTMTTEGGTVVWPPTQQAKNEMQRFEDKQARKAATKEEKMSDTKATKSAAKGAANPAKGAAKTADKPAAKGADKPVKADKPAADKPVKKPAKETSREAYAGKTIKVLVKNIEETGLREGSLRAKRLELVMKCKTTDEALAKTFKVEGVEHGIDGSNLRGMVERGHISLS